MPKAKDPSPEPAAADPRPRLRGDLRLVHDPRGGQPGPVRVIDPLTGQQFTLTAAEHALAQAADGQTDLARIASRAGVGDGAMVTALFRRLERQGLLAASATTPPRNRPIRRLAAPAVKAVPEPALPVVVPAAAPRQRLSARKSAPQTAPAEAPAPVVMPTAAPRKRLGASKAAPQPAPAEPPAPALAPAAAPRKRLGTRKVVPQAAAAETPAPAATPAAAPRKRLSERRRAPETGVVPQDAAALVPVPADAPDSPAPEIALPEAGPSVAPRKRLSERRRAATPPRQDRETVSEKADPLLAAPEPLATGGAADLRAPTVPGAVPVADMPLAGSAAGATPARRRRARIAARAAQSGGQPAALALPPTSPPTSPLTPPPTPVATLVPPSEAAPVAIPPAGAVASPAAVAPSGPVPEALDVVAANLAPPLPWEDDEDEDLLGPSDPAGRTGPGGGFGGRRGGLAGILAEGGLGGGMGGGMGGGGLAAALAGGMGGGMGGAMGGGGNRERLMAAIAARRGGQTTGAADPAGAPPEAEPRGMARLTLLDPGLLLRLLYVLFYPLRFVLWALVPMVALAGMTLFQNWPALARDLALLMQDYSRLAMLIFSLFTVNLASRLAQGVAVIAWGGRVRTLGLTLMLGVIPRFFIDQSAIAGLDRRGQLWAHAAPLLARLGLFAAGVILWAILQGSGNMLPLYALLVGQFGLITFVLTALPLVPGDGMRWIATYLGEPRLLPKTLLVLRHVLTGAALPSFVGRADIVPLVLYGFGMMLSMVALALTFLIYAGLTLKTELGGLGVVIFLGLVAGFVIWLLALRLGIVRRAADRRAAATGGLGPELMAAMRDGQAPATDPVARTSGAARVIWGVVMAGLLAVAFLPYDYEAGGTVEILPLARGQAVARSDGEVLEVMVAEGEIVAAGQVVAQLSAWNQSREVAVTQAQLAAAEANLARLQAGPKAEEIALAQSELERAESSLAFSQAEAQRTRDLAESGTVSRQALEQANATYETDLAGLEVARANLALVQSGATPEELAIAEAEVARLRVELAFREDELDRTRITAPMAGRVITADLDLRHGSFLRVGETLLEIENADVVNAMIAVPESDIALVTPGDEVRLKVWGQDGEIAGLVQSIAPAAAAEGYGSVVRVTASFPNPEALLRSGMTGYAKVDGAEMRVWEAYLRRIVRFFEVEVWSWIP